jgi:hypothetical protein
LHNLLAVISTLVELLRHRKLEQRSKYLGLFSTRLAERAELLFLASQRPILVRKLRYFDEPEFWELFDEVTSENKI